MMVFRDFRENDEVMEQEWIVGLKELWNGFDGSDGNDQRERQ